MVDFRIDVIVDPSRAQAGTRVVERGLTRVQNRADELRSTLRNVFAFVGIGFAIRQIRSMVDEFVAMQNRLRTVTDDQQELNDTFEVLSGIANRTRTELSGVVNLYQRGSIAADELGASNEQLLFFVERVGEALAVQGQSLQESRGALRQLSQALSTGIVRGEEFNSILEGAFPVAQAAARGIDEAGGSVGRLRTLVIQGQITSREFFQGILEGSERLQEQFARTVPTISQAFTILTNNLTRFIGEQDRSQGASTALARALIGIGNNIDVIAEAIRNLLILLGPRFLLGAIRTLTAVIAANPLGLFLVTASAVIAAVPELQEAFNGLIETLTEFGSLALEAFDFQDAILSIASSIDIIISLFNGMLAAVGVIFDNLGMKPDEVGELIVKGFRDAIEATLDFFFAFAQTVGNIIIGLGRDVIDLVANVGGAIGALSRGNLQAAQQFAELQETALTRAANRVATFTGQLRSNLTKLQDVELLPEVELSKGARELGNTVTNEFERGVAESGSPVTDFIAKLFGAESEDEVKNEVKRISTELADIFGDPFANFDPNNVRAVESLIKRLDVQRQVNEQIQILNELFRQGKIDVETYGLAFDELQLRGLEASTSLEAGFERAFIKIRQEAEDLASVGEEIVNLFADRATDALIEFARTGEFSFREFASAILEELTRIIARLLIVQALSAIAGGGTAPLTPAQVPFPQTSGRQHGGSVAPNRSYVVGEDGPELLTMGSTGGFISPNEIFQQQAPEVNVQVVNVDNENMVPQTISRGGADEAIINVLARNKDRVNQVIR